jgi:hypothetical protein
MSLHAAPVRQRAPASFRYPHLVRPRIPRRRSTAPPVGQPRLRAEFSNGDQFYAKAGQIIDLPERRADRPSREFLEWHFDEVFLKAAAS